MEFIATIVFIVFAFGLQLYKEAKVHLAEKERSRPVPPNVWGTRFTKIIRNGKRK